ncbi:MAG: hypothetical protein Q9187_006564 [Circinaria calcarea]
MSIALKISSLFIRTLSKPIANRIKKSAKEHETFRRMCVSLAQSLHRADMRLRLGLLQNPEAIEKQIAREAAEAAAKKQKSEIPTVKTQAQAEADEISATKEMEKTTEKTKSTASKPRIRPLSEAKAIDSGANFISETFLFGVGLSLIIFERYWSKRKEAARREDVNDELNELKAEKKATRQALIALEREVLRLREKGAKTTDKKHILPKEILESLDVDEETEEPQTWLSWIKGFGRRNKSDPNPDTVLESDTRPEYQSASSPIKQPIPLPAAAAAIPPSPGKS